MMDRETAQSLAEARYDDIAELALKEGMDWAAMVKVMADVVEYDERPDDRYKKELRRMPFFERAKGDMQVLINQLVSDFLYGSEHEPLNEQIDEIFGYLYALIAPDAFIHIAEMEETDTYGYDYSSIAAAADIWGFRISDAARVIAELLYMNEPNRCLHYDYLKRMPHRSLAFSRAEYLCIRAVDEFGKEWPSALGYLLQIADHQHYDTLVDRIAQRMVEADW